MARRYRNFNSYNFEKRKVYLKNLTFQTVRRCSEWFVESCPYYPWHLQSLAYQLQLVSTLLLVPQFQRSMHLFELFFSLHFLLHWEADDLYKVKICWRYTFDQIRLIIYFINIVISTYLDINLWGRGSLWE